MKKIKIAPVKGRKVLRVIKGKKHWSFEGDPPFEVNQGDYDKYLKKDFEIYRENQTG